VGATVASSTDAGRQAKTVVGVAADAVYGSLRDDVLPTEYAPLTQFSFGAGCRPNSASVSVSSAGSPMRLARGVAAALTVVDRDLVFTFRPIADQVNASLTQERLIAMLSGFFGVLALLLAGWACTASRRMRSRAGELSSASAWRSAPRPAPWCVCAVTRSLLVGAGVIVGAAASVWLSQFIATLLFGVELRDP